MEYKNKYDVDGMMIGRASIGYPWIFREIKHYFNTGELLAPPSIQERISAAKTHLMNSIKWKGEKLGVLEMRRHYTNYFKGLANIKDYRILLVTESNPIILYEILDRMNEEMCHEIFELSA